MPHRSSTVTRRAAAVSDTASTTGSLAIHAETITVQTRERVEIVDLTDRVAAFTAAHPVREGIVTVWSLHTTCAIFINESQQALHADIKRQAMARGLMVYPMGGTIDGQRGDHVLLAPPFIVSDAELDAIVERLRTAIDAAIVNVATKA